MLPKEVSDELCKMVRKKMKILVDILEVDKHASQEEIKASFRRLAKEYHPDSGHFRSPSQKREAQETFKLTNEAYHILKDPIKRNEYDTFFNYIILGSSSRCRHRRKKIWAIFL